MDDFNDLVQEFHNFRCRNPITCTWLGISGKDHLLQDRSKETATKDIDDAKSIFSKANEMSRDNLTFNQKLDLDLISLSIKNYIFHNTFTINGKKRTQVTPNAGEVIGNAINPLFIRDERDAETRLDLILSRLKSINRFLRESFDRLDKPVKRWVEIELSTCAGFPFLLDNIFKWGESIDYPKIEELRKAKWDAEDSINNYMDKLENIETTEDFSMGESQTREWLKLRGIDLSLEELHQIAKDFLKKNKQEVEILRKRLTPKYNLSKDASIEEVTRVIISKHKLKVEEIIPRYKQEQARINAFIEEQNLFVSPPNEKLVIEATPKYLIPVISMGANYEPKAFGEEVKKSIIYLTVTEDHLEDQNTISIINTIIHEGKPGHHLHFANALSNPSIVRKHCENQAKELLEGWSTLMEEYMIEIGFVKKDIADETQFLAKQELARIGTRVAIDLYFMTGNEKYLDVELGIEIPKEGDCFKKASYLLSKTTSFSEARCQGEVNWYSQLPGYPLSYLAGNYLVKKLKEDMKNYMKGRLEGSNLDRVFHKTLLTAGLMPVTFLRRVFENERLIEKA